MKSGNHPSFDTISLDHDSEACVLTLVAHEIWKPQQLLAMQERINACLHAIESGDLYLAHPGACGREFVIDIRSIYAPDTATLAFLSQAQPILEDAGHRLRFGPLGSCYVQVDD